MKNNLLRIIFALMIIFAVVISVVYLNNKTPLDNGTENSSAINTPSDGELTDEETDEGTPVTEDEIIAKANKILAKMSLREKIYQMFIVTPDALSGQSGTKSASSALISGIKTFPVGGIIFFTENIESENQIKDMVKNTAQQSEIPMFISIDQEGGTVARLKENVSFPVFKNMYRYKDMGENTAYKNAKTIAENLADFGFNLDFAPVADVWTNKANTVIGERAYSDNYNQAAKLVSSAVKGFNDGGVICTLKHFPGHGDTYADTHQKLGYVKKTKEQLKNGELIPFVSGIKAGADMVMVGHLVVPEIDSEYPATLSKAVTTDLLKGDLGFDGVVITDALNMNAVSNMYSSYQLCPMAVKAGVDIILMPAELRPGAAGIENAVLSGHISEERINESVRKILILKIKRGIIS